jgi:hypothetical protein
MAVERRSDGEISSSIALELYLQSIVRFPFFVRLHRTLELLRAAGWNFREH